MQKEDIKIGQKLRYSNGLEIIITGPGAQGYVIKGNNSGWCIGDIMAPNIILDNSNWVLIGNREKCNKCKM